MPLLTEDDLDALSHQSMLGGKGKAIAAQILAAVDAGDIADPEDIPYALTIVAEIADRALDLDGALAMARRAVEAHGEHVDVAVSYQHGFLAELLLRAGHEEEGLTFLESLRPAMATQVMASTEIAEALESDERSETAVEWLTAALEEAIRAGQDLDVESPEAAVNAAVIYENAALRHRLRENLGLDHDDYDTLFHELEQSLAEEEAPDAQLFWPEADFEQLRAAWPSIAEAWEPAWDEHRLGIETAMQQWWGQGATDVVLLVGSAEALTAFAAREQLSLADPDDLDDAEQGYLDGLAEDEQAVRQPWPPRRNEACWCGSGAKYKKCCQIRVRL
jgi:hypothetical protein